MVHPPLLALKIPWAEEPGRLWYMGSKRVGHNLVAEYTHTYTHTASLHFLFAPGVGKERLSLQLEQ